MKLLIGIWKMQRKKVDLVVIGLNTIDTLKKIYKTDYLLKIKDHFDGLIYVDSGSRDGSQELMSSLGFRVYQVTSSLSNAALGRHIGTLESDADYICFVDSDMEISSIEKLIYTVNHKLNDIDVGVVGDVLDVYRNGTTRLRARKNRKYATSFGGFVTIERNTLVNAGNWNVNLVANEELELYVKLKVLGKKVLYTSELRVFHYTIVSSSFVELLSIYLPIRKSRYGSLGIVLKQMNSIKKLFEFIKLQPEVFLLFSILILALINFKLFVFFLFPLLIYNTYRRGWKYNVVVPGLFLSGILGLFKKVEKVSVVYEKV